MRRLEGVEPFGGLLGGSRDPAPRRASPSRSARRRCGGRSARCSRPSCSGTMAKVLGRAMSVALLRRRPAAASPARASDSSSRADGGVISDVEALRRQMRSNSVSRSATSCGGMFASRRRSATSRRPSRRRPTCATWRRFLCSSSTKTPRLAGHDQEQRLGVLAVALQLHAARQAEPVRFRQHAPERRIADIGEQREIRAAARATRPDRRSRARLGRRRGKPCSHCISSSPRRPSAIDGEGGAGDEARSVGWRGTGAARRSRRPRLCAAASSSRQAVAANAGSPLATLWCGNGPGTKAFTRIFSGPNSAARWRVSWSRAAFAGP